MKASLSRTLTFVVVAVLLVGVTMTPASAESFLMKGWHLLMGDVKKGSTTGIEVKAVYWAKNGMPEGVRSAPKRDGANPLCGDVVDYSIALDPGDIEGRPVALMVSQPIPPPYGFGEQSKLAVWADLKKQYEGQGYLCPAPGFVIQGVETVDEAVKHRRLDPAEARKLDHGGMDIIGVTTRDTLHVNLRWYTEFSMPGINYQFRALAIGRSKPQDPNGLNWFEFLAPGFEVMSKAMENASPEALARYSMVATTVKKLVYSGEEGSGEGKEWTGDVCFNDRGFRKAGRLHDVPFYAKPRVGDTIVILTEEGEGDSLGGGKITGVDLEKHEVSVDFGSVHVNRYRGDLSKVIVVLGREFPVQYEMRESLTEEEEQWLCGIPETQPGHPENRLRDAVKEMMLVTPPAVHAMRSRSTGKFVYIMKDGKPDWDHYWGIHESVTPLKHVVQPISVSGGRKAKEAVEKFMECRVITRDIAGNGFVARKDVERRIIQTPGLLRLTWALNPGNWNVRNWLSQSQSQQQQQQQQQDTDIVICE